MARVLPSVQFPSAGNILLMTNGAPELLVKVTVSPLLGLGLVVKVSPAGLVSDTMAA